MGGSKKTGGGSRKGLELDTTTSKSAEGESEYDVEAILDKTMDNGVALYLVKWKGWSNADNTWEPLSNLTGCDELLKKFEASDVSTNKKSTKKGKKEPGGRDEEGTADFGQGLPSLTVVGPIKEEGPIVEMMATGTVHSMAVLKEEPVLLESIKTAEKEGPFDTDMEAEDQASVNDLELNNLELKGEAYASAEEPVIASDPEEDEYLVEAILDKKVEDGIQLFYVKWKGWDSSANTWEPLDHLKGCEALLRKFEASWRTKEKAKKPKTEKKKHGMALDAVAEGSQAQSQTAIDETESGMTETDKDARSKQDSNELGKSGPAAKSKKRGSKLGNSEFDVERIVGKRDQDGQLLYEVKWKGWASSDNTWEPVANLRGCERLLQEFEEKESTAQRKTRKRNSSHSSRALLATAEEGELENDEQGVERDVLEECPPDLTPVFIVGLIAPTTEIGMLFLVEFKVNGAGEEVKRYKVQSRSFKEAYPQLVISFFESHLSWNRPSSQAQKKKKKPANSAKIKFRFKKPKKTRAGSSADH